jgi:hypothetical protein
MRLWEDTICCPNVLNKYIVDSSFNYPAKFFIRQNNPVKLTLNM